MMGDNPLLFLKEEEELVLFLPIPTSMSFEAIPGRPWIPKIILKPGNN